MEDQELDLDKMSRKYGKSKALGGGAGLQFDKLLKACSNSKKPSVTKTAGALGRFGMASFTSTRNSSFDGGDLLTKSEEPRYTPSKRPRFDVDLNLSGLEENDSFCYGKNLLVTSQPGQLEAAVSMVIKPKKFFKSRNPDSDQNVRTGGSNIYSVHSRLPPLPMPIKIPTPRIHHDVATSNGNKSDRKTSTSSSDVEVNTSSTSPIKLRIFKDKKTAKFVSVSDTISPPKLERQVEKDENIFEVHQKKRGRKPKTEVRAKPEPVPQRRSGRVTRNSLRHRSGSDSVSDMPVLTAADDSLESVEPLPSTPSPLPSTESVQKVDSAKELVQRLEEEDQEFRELSAVLSSMEDASEHCAESSKSKMSQGSPAYSSNSAPNQLHDEITPLLTQFQDEVTPQPSPINYSLTASTAVQLPPSELYVDTASVPDTSSRDFRSILEDEWDENCEDESPRRSHSVSPTKVSRFDMPEITSPSAKTPSTEHQNYVVSSAQAQVSPQPPLNSSYAVRNLLSEITGSDFSSQQIEGCAPPPLQLESSEEIGPFSAESSTLPVTPEKPILAKDLIGSAKKVSIFKSRINPESSSSGQAINPKKRLALYKHKFGQEVAENVNLPTSPRVTTLDPDTFSDAPESLTLHRRGVRTDEFGNEISDGSKVYCSRQAKKLFTVVRNVKAVHELQESGEVHEFDGDIWYILEDLKQSNPVSKRCLSAITLATRCMEPAFRMHLRAHGTVSDFCRELRDAPNNIPVLALAAATVLFILSQDRLNMDLDTESFLLILALAKTENSEFAEDSQELSKHTQRIIDLVEEMQSRGHAKHIKIDKITTSELALETLLFLTSKRAGEWVKRELRTLGGLEYIVTEIEKSLAFLEIGENILSENLSESLWKIDRCLKVLQQVTFNHEENQKYLLGVQNTDLPRPLYSPQLFVRLFQFLTHHLSYQTNVSEHFTVLREVLFSNLRVLVNLTHDYRGIVLGSEILSNHEGFLNLTLHSIFTLTNVLVDGKGFDLLMHSLCMLLNIVEHSKRNREVVLSMRVQLPGVNINQELPTLDALIQLFFQKEMEAQKEEASTDYILTNSTDKKDENSQSQSQTSDSQGSSLSQDSSESNSVQDIIDKLIETAGKHMENSMIAAHISLLIAYLVMDDPDSTSHLINAMPASRLLPLMILLKKLFNFMSITTSTAGSTRGLKATSIALKFFEKCDPESTVELKKIIPD